MQDTKADQSISAPDQDLEHELAEIRREQTENQENIEENLDRKILELKEQNWNQYCEDLKSLEVNDSNQLDHFFVADILDASDCYERMRMFDMKEYLERVIQEFRGSRSLPIGTQSERNQAGNQSFEVLKNLQNKCGLDEYYFGEHKNMKRIMRLSAISSRLGMTAEARRGKLEWRNGQPRYLGYEIESGAIIQNIMARLNTRFEAAGEKNIFSKKDMLIGSSLVRNHDYLRIKIMGPNKGDEADWESEVSRRAKDWLKRVYSVELLNNRCDFQEVVEAHLIAAKSELESLRSGIPYKQKALERYEVFRNYVESNINLFEEQQKLRLIKYFIDGKDLMALGIHDGPELKELISEARHAQVQGRVETREQALSFVALAAKEKFNKEISEARISEIAKKPREIKFKMENMRLHDIKNSKGFSAYYYSVEPIKQFDDNVTLEEIKRTMENGNYPYMEAYFSSQNLSKPKEQIIMELIKKGFSHLDQIEGIIRRYPAYPVETIEQAHAPLARHVEVRRDDKTRIILENGFQGKDHEGEGKLHINYQRLHDLLKHYSLEKEKFELTEETAKKIKTLEFHVVNEKKEFQRTLDKINADRNIKLISRSDDFHVTIVGPSEIKALNSLGGQQIRQISEELAKETKISVNGIGLIDASRPEKTIGLAGKNIREADKNKKTCFIALESETIRKIREDALKLQPRHAHMTLGFEGGDIHEMIETDKNGNIVYDEKNKPKRKFIPKLPNEKFRKYLKYLPKEISTRGLQAQFHEKYAENQNPQDARQKNELLIEEFFHNGIIPAAGNPDVEIINARKHDKGSTIAVRRMDHTEKPQYCGVILIPSGNREMKIVTSIFMASKKSMRNSMQLYLKQMARTEYGIPKAKILDNLEEMNDFLKREGIKPLAVEDIDASRKTKLEEGTKTQDTPKQQRKEPLLVTYEDLKSRGFGKKEISSLIGFFEERRKSGNPINREQAIEILRNIHPGSAKKYIASMREKEK